MISRRTMLAGGASLATLATMAWRWDMSALADTKFEVTHSEDEWRKLLTPEQFNVLRKHGTERAGTSPLNGEKHQGTFACAGCGQPLFSSETKFESGTGWPSFFKPLPHATKTSSDRAWFMTRTEVHCSRCGGHLGHVFPDGPKPTGERYCMNGVALKFEPKDVSSAG
jgi:peptide-methionine (R)-S-oxide reductase